MMVGNLVAGKRIAQAAGRDLGVIEDQDLVRKVAQPRTQELTFNLVSLKQKPAVHYMHACPADYQEPKTANASNNYCKFRFFLT